ncbi:hypothetical protein A3A49_00130 [Candidatus Curtissbacteria bacterium RIFCSPLOWO2_01_FULL_38_11b]|uniref:Peptide-methionine (S)-S-oxide reductase n=1 Tax=Candidatus Curtissbacteria bacterium RIFCSPLOWO2_01_FULL_38_11b TaxID=1797725 RepID=A0A1F5H369_9BACT|nr:MAG: hypothetical protein A3A49_00130 [Candidatus Curtissbacteria bacterium RIFCSPLOWO2_01_FULL_38_11b]
MLEKYVAVWHSSPLGGVFCQSVIKSQNMQNFEIATLAAGCFWCTEGWGNRFDVRLISCLF